MDWNLVWYLYKINTIFSKFNFVICSFNNFLYIGMCSLQSFGINKVVFFLNFKSLIISPRSCLACSPVEMKYFIDLLNVLNTSKF